MAHLSERRRSQPLGFSLAGAVAGTASTRLGQSTFAGCSLRSASAQIAAHPRAGRRARVEMQQAAPKIGRPKTQIKKNVGTSSVVKEPEPEAGKGAAKARPRRKTQSDEVPMFKVILLGDEEYEEGHVVTQLQKTAGLEKQKAQSCFKEAQATGTSIVCVVCEEHAEFYAQQLRRQEIYVAVEKDE